MAVFEWASVSSTALVHTNVDRIECHCAWRLFTLSLSICVIAYSLSRQIIDTLGCRGVGSKCKVVRLTAR